MVAITQAPSGSAVRISGWNKGIRAPRSSQPLRDLLTGPLQELGPVPVSEDDDRDEFAAQLDTTCVAVADHAMQRLRLAQGPMT
jgi:hypothetical protein